MERLRVSCREAELFDQQAVTEMSQGIYNGADYTPSVFPQWTADENWQCYVAETAEGIVVAFLALHICDGESSVTERSARVAESYQGKGLYTLLLDYSLLSIQLKYPSITNVVRVRNFGKAIPPNYNARNQYIYNAIKCCFPSGDVISAAEQEASTQTDLATLTISNNKFSELFEYNEWLRTLFPHGIFLIGDHVYHVGKLESRKHIDKQDDLVFIHSCDGESGSDDERVFSVADFSPKKNVLGNEVFSLDVYGNDINMLKYHIMKVMNMAWKLANGAVFSIALNIHSKHEELCKIIDELEHCHVYDYEEMEVMEANIKLHPYRNQLSDINNNHMIKVPN